MKTLSKRTVDICMCVKNRGYIIKKSIENIKKQTFSDFNIIVCDGHSIDNTPNVLIDLNKETPNLKVLQIDEDKTYIDAHNAVLSETVSDYICWVDSDDVITTHKMKTQVEFLESHPEVDIVTTGTMYMMSDKTVIMPNSIVELSHDEITDLINKGYSLSDICHFQSAMFRKSCLEKFKNGKYFFDEYVNGRCGEGFMLTLYYLGYKFHNIPNLMYCHSLDFNGMTAQIDGKHIFADEINEKTNGRRKQAIMKLFNKYNK